MVYVMMMMVMVKVAALLTVVAVGTLASPSQHSNPTGDKYIYYNEPSNDNNDNNNYNYNTGLDESYRSYSDGQRSLYANQDNYNYDLENLEKYKHDYNTQAAVDEYYEGSNYHRSIESSPHERLYDQIIQDSISGNYEDVIYNSIFDGDVNKELYGHETPDFTREESVPEPLHYLNETTGQLFFDELYHRPDFKVFRNVKDFLTSRLGPEHEWDKRLPVDRQDGTVDTGLGLAIIGAALIAQLILVSSLVASCNNRDDNDQCTTTCDLPDPDCTTSTCALNTPVILFIFNQQPCVTTCRKQNPTCTTTCNNRKKRDLSAWFSGWSEGGMISKAAETLRNSGLWSFMEGLNILPGGTGGSGTGRVLCDIAGRFIM